MKSFKESLKMIALKKCLLYLGLAVLIGIALWSQDVSDYFKPECVIDSVQDVARCQGENKYVEVNFDTIYQTNYAYTINEKETGLFVDIDLDGYSLIAVVPISYEEDLFSGDKTTVHGTLEVFQDEAMIDGYQKIQQQYLEEFKDDATEEEILEMFLPYQLNAYNGKKSDITLNILLFIIPFIVVCCFAIYHFYRFIKPDMKQIYGKKDSQREETIKKMEDEYLHKEKEYQKNSLTLTEHYVIQKTTFLLKANQIDNIVWIYNRIIKQYGREVNRFLIICFNDGTSMNIRAKQEEYDKIVEIIQTKNDHILYGYKPEYQKAWKNNSALKKES